MIEISIGNVTPVEVADKEFDGNNDNEGNESVEPAVTTRNGAASPSKAAIRTDADLSDAIHPKYLR
jgi:hypothetical protein